jgi:ribokinase
MSTPQPTTVQAASPQVAVIGSANVDMVMTMPRLPARGETVGGAVFFQTFGGKGANQAVAAARAGARTSLYAAVGQDPYAERMCSELARDGIDCSGIRRIADVPSGHALCMIGEAGANYLSVAPGANFRLGPQMLDTDVDRLRATPVWLLQCEIPEETNRHLLDRVRTAANRVVWNFAPAVPMPDPPLARADVLVVNEIEAAQLSGLPVGDDMQVRAAAAHFHVAGVGDVVITLGDRGAFYSGRAGCIHQPCFPVRVVDTVAAGDTFCGALACRLAEGAGWREALEFASAAAAVSVGRAGAQPSIPHRGEIDDLLRQSAHGLSS